MPRSSDYKPVPVQTAKDIALAFEKSQVVILAQDDLHDVRHVTTYGRTARDKVLAALTGERCREALGIHGDPPDSVTFEDFRAAYDPARYKEAQELLLEVRHIVDIPSPASQAVALDRLKPRLGAFLAQSLAAQAFPPVKENPCESQNNESSPP